MKGRSSDGNSNNTSKQHHRNGRFRHSAPSALDDSETEEQRQNQRELLETLSLHQQHKMRMETEAAVAAAAVAAEVQDDDDDDDDDDDGFARESFARPSLAHATIMETIHSQEIRLSDSSEDEAAGDSRRNSKRKTARREDRSASPPVSPPPPPRRSTKGGGSSVSPPPPRRVRNGSSLSPRRIRDGGSLSPVRQQRRQSRRRSSRQSISHLMASHSAVAARRRSSKILQASLNAFEEDLAQTKQELLQREMEVNALRQEQQPLTPGKLSPSPSAANVSSSLQQQQQQQSNNDTKTDQLEKEMDLAKEAAKNPYPAQAKQPTQQQEPKQQQQVADYPSQTAKEPENSIKTQQGTQSYPSQNAKQPEAAAAAGKDDDEMTKEKSKKAAATGSQDTRSSGGKGILTQEERDSLSKQRNAMPLPPPPLEVRNSDRALAEKGALSQRNLLQGTPPPPPLAARNSDRALAEKGALSQRNLVQDRLPPPPLAMRSSDRALMEKEGVIVSQQRHLTQEDDNNQVHQSTSSQQPAPPPPPPLTQPRRSGGSSQQLMFPPPPPLTQPRSGGTTASSAASSISDYAAEFDDDVMEMPAMPTLTRQTARDTMPQTQPGAVSVRPTQYADDPPLPQANNNDDNVDDTRHYDSFGGDTTESDGDDDSDTDSFSESDIPDSLLQGIPEATPIRASIVRQEEESQQELERLQRQMQAKQAEMAEMQRKLAEMERMKQELENLKSGVALAEPVLATSSHHVLQAAPPAPMLVSAVSTASSIHTTKTSMTMMDPDDLIKQQEKEQRKAARSKGMSDAEFHAYQILIGDKKEDEAPKEKATKSSYTSSRSLFSSRHKSTSFSKHSKTSSSTHGGGGDVTARSSRATNDDETEVLRMESSCGDLSGRSKSSRNLSNKKDDDMNMQGDSSGLSINIGLGTSESTQLMSNVKTTKPPTKTDDPANQIASAILGDVSENQQPVEQSACCVIL